MCKINKLNESKKNRFIKKHPNLTPEQKEELVKLYSEQYIPDDIIDWNIFNSFSYEELRTTVDTFIKGREEKINKKNLSKAIEGRDYLKVFENTNSEGTEYLYLPLTWLGSKYLASDHFLPKIKVPSKLMSANDFSDNSAKDEDLSPGAKWCISLWTIPDLVIDDEPVTDKNGKELRHEGKRHWLIYTIERYYFLFYFRDYNNLEDINKKVAFTLEQGSSFIRDITLADDTRGEGDSDMERVQKYWNEHYKEYESQIKHIREVSTKEKPEFDEYEKQKEEEAMEYYKSYRKEYILRGYLTYNESTGRYDCNHSLGGITLKYLVKDGEIIVPLGVINGDFGCYNLGLKTLKNGPTEVTGLFNCYSNNLKTLEGAPQEVGGYFDCGKNLLTTLKDAPRRVGGDFYCSKNRLTSLEGAPKYVGGEFDCSVNNLTSLKYAPEYVGGGFDCDHNQLTTLEGAPKEVGGFFNCSNNNLTTLEYVPEYVEGNFVCPHNQLTTLEYAPKKVEGDFYCWDNPLQSKKLSSKVRGRLVYY